jgi:integrase
MGRPRKIWKRNGSAYYYTKIDGKQTRLETTEKASQRKLEQLLRGNLIAPNGSVTFACVADQFLDHSQAVNEPETYQVHRLFLQSFKNHVGSRLVTRLCEADVDRWCRKHDSWGDNTCVRAKAIVLAALNYGVRKLGMPMHPLAHVRPGTVGSREKYLTDEERRKIRAAVKGVFADYIFALEQTGARPFSEVCKVTAADVDVTAGTWTLSKWKNAKKQKGKKRVIYLTDGMLALTKRLMQKYPEGPLFRNATGTPWSRQSITWRFRQLGEKLGINQLTAYAVRHGFITDALGRGIAVSVVAELCGTSIQTIQKHYNHLNVRHDVLREAMKQAVGD